jgi:hypothetical protein
MLALLLIPLGVVVLLTVANVVTRRYDENRSRGQSGR